MPRPPASRTLVLSVTAALALLVGAACSTTSGSGGLDTDDPNVAAAVDQAEDLGFGSESIFKTAAERNCFEEHPQLHDLDVGAILGDAHATPQRVLLFEILLDCAEDPATNPGLVNNVRVGFDAIAPTAAMSDEEASCFIRTVLEEADDPALLMVGGGGESDAMVAYDAAERCLTPENFAIFTGAEGAGPQEYGDDPRFDSMWDDCSAGDLRACDLLYLQASVGSGYETHAETCGGTDPDTSTFCSPDTDVDDDWMLVPGSEGARALTADCEAGDLTACDLLYQIAPFGSEMETIGGTCAGRIAVGAVPDCRTRLG